MFEKVSIGGADNDDERLAIWGGIDLVCGRYPSVQLIHKSRTKIVSPFYSCRFATAFAAGARRARGERVVYLHLYFDAERSRSACSDARVAFMRATAELALCKTSIAFGPRRFRG